MWSMKNESVITNICYWVKYIFVPRHGCKMRMSMS